VFEKSLGKGWRYLHSIVDELDTEDISQIENRKIGFGIPPRWIGQVCANWIIHVRSSFLWDL
jgi:hypothetical protein